MIISELIQEREKDKINYEEIKKFIILSHQGKEMKGKV